MNWPLPSRSRANRAASTALLAIMPVLMSMMDGLRRYRTPRSRRYRPILSSGDGFANLFDRRIQKGLRKVGIVDNAR
jgi:hypothetical protein